MNQFKLSWHRSLLTVFQFLLTCLGQQCNTPFGCDKTIISFGSAHIWITAAHGCFNCDAIMAIEGSSARIQCYGAFSCYNTSLLLSTVNRIDCEALYSCGSIPNITAYYHLYCRASRSCEGSTIYLTDPTTRDEFLCLADRSCINSIVTDYGNTYIQLHGYLAAQNTIFYVVGDDSYFELFGALSAYNTIIYCDSNITCSLQCRGDACNHLNLLCTRGDDACTFNTDCSLAQQSEICPNGYSLERLPSFLTSLDTYVSPALRLINLTTSDFESSYFPCNYSGSTQCNTEYACDSRELRSTQLTSNSHDICCTGEWSCLFANVTIFSGDSPNIRCDGHESCREIRSFLVTDDNNDSINVLWTGSYVGWGEKQLQLNKNSNMFCEGELGCYGVSNFTRGDNAYCNGVAACISGYFRDWNNIFVLSVRAAMGMQVLGVTDSIYCNSDSACRYSKIDGVENEIYAFGYYALADANVANVGSSVVAVGTDVATNSLFQNISHTLVVFGSYAFYESEATSVPNVYCVGDESCALSEISDVEYLFAQGTDALVDATVVSSKRVNDTNVNEVLIEINGTNTAEFDVYCSVNDTCRIKCLSENACTHLVLHCFGACIISCNDGYNISCPWNRNESEYTIWTTSEPTNLPTSVPSRFPTLNPSFSPSSAPTMIPTMTPTNGPTFQPSEGPSASPSVAPSVAPSVEPSSAPTWSPSVTPTLEPTDAPIAAPTMLPTEPTEMPTLSPTWRPSINPTDGPTSHPVVNTYSDVIGLLDQTAKFMVCGGAPTALFLYIFIYVHHEFMFKRHGCDRSRIYVVFKLTHGVIDFWTDLLFSLLLYYQRYQISSYVYIASFTFVLVPFTLQCIVSAYFVFQWKNWKQDHPIRFQNYLNRYDILLYLFTLLLGFYNTVDLIQSKLYYHNFFDFPIKRSESSILRRLYFINIVILENIPQFIIQMLYISFAEKDDYNNIAFFSLMLTVLSLIFAFLKQTSLCLQRRRNRSTNKYTDSCRICGVITLESSHFRRQHAFCQKRLSLAMRGVLETCPDSVIWSNRSDVSYEIEVYFVKDYIFATKRFDACFDITIRSLQSLDSKRSKHINDLICLNIDAMCIKWHANYSKTQIAFESTLCVPGIENIYVNDLNMISLRAADQKSVVNIGRVRSQSGSPQNSGPNSPNMSVSNSRVHHAHLSPVYMHPPRSQPSQESGVFEPEIEPVAPLEMPSFLPPSRAEVSGTNSVEQSVELQAGAVHEIPPQARPVQMWQISQTSQMSHMSQASQVSQPLSHMSLEGSHRLQEMRLDAEGSNQYNGGAPMLIVLPPVASVAPAPRETHASFYKEGNKNEVFGNTANNETSSEESSTPDSTDLDQFNDASSASGGLSKVSDNTNITNQINGEMNSEIELIDDNKHFEKWNQTQVLAWLRQSLLDSGIKYDIIEPFLIEFKGKEIDGRMLKKFQTNYLLFDQFKLVFSETNRSEKIWNALEMNILALQYFSS